MLTLLRIILLIDFNHNCIEVDCIWGLWKSWSACTKSCGGGTRTKNRSKSITEAYGGTCLGNWIETQECNMQNCPGKFVLIFLIDLVLILIHCFNVWTLWKTLLNHLNFNDVEVDCTWAPWKSWSICTKSCGGGTRTKNRTKLVIEAYGGTCLGNRTETQVCNEQKCPGTNTAYFYIRIVLIYFEILLYWALK